MKKLLLALLFLTTTTVFAQQGAALDFDGTNDYATIANNSSFNVNQFTIETWLKWDASSTVVVPFVCSKGYENMEIHLNKTNKSIRFIPTAGVFIDTDANTLPENTWFHVACVYNPTTSLAKIYINGVDLNTTNAGANPLSSAVINNISPLLLGSRGVSVFPFKGAFDEFRVWNRALTQTEIVARMNCEIPTTACGLITNLHFNQGLAGLSNTTISALTDSSGFNNNASLANFDLTGTSSNFVASGGVVSNTSCTNILNVAPTAAATQTFCGNATIASLTATGTNLLWYANATGGTALTTSNALTTTTTYYVSQTINGCESARTAVAVTITPSTDNVTTISACGSYTWANNNQTYTTTGVYTGTTTNCVTEKLDLTITPITEYLFTKTACSSYEWKGKRYSESGIYYSDLSNDCAVEKLELTIKTFSPFDDEPYKITACGSYTYKGKTYTESAYVFDYNDEEYCRARYTDIYIIPATVNTTNVTQCGSYTWPNNGQTYTVSGTYTGTTTNCVTEKLNLTILNAPTNFTVNGINYVVTGTNTVAVDVTPTASGAITIPATVSSICNTYTVTSIGDAAFFDCAGLTSITIPNSVTSIGYNAFNNCTNLLSVTVPNSVTSIVAYTFNNCTSLTSVTLPSSITSIGDGAFSSCNSLSSITIPNSVTSIGDSAFSNCTSLASVTVSWATPLNINSIGAFTGINTNATLIVPPDKVATYDAAPVWTNFFNIIENCSTVTYNETTTTACGSYTWASNGQTYTTSGVYTTPTVNCVADKLNLTINAIPSAPTASATQTFVGLARVSSLVATGSNIKWYSTATGGSALAAITNLVNGNVYYASQTINCESARTAVTVSITHPEIFITGRSSEIVSGTTTTSITTGTNIGNLKLGSSLTRTYVINNTGTSNLTIGEITLNNSNYTVVKFPANTLVPNDTTEFKIKFTPISLGNSNCTVSIVSNDANENPYTFALTSVGVSPEIIVKGRNNEIVSGTSIASGTVGCDFGTVNLSSNFTRSYTISNTGTSSLTLGTVTFSNPNYTLTKPLGTSIEPGGTAGFSIKYTPSTLGTSACTVTIPNNDSNENPYTFALTSVGVSPEIIVKGRNNEIVSGTSVASGTVGCDFGTVNLSSSFTRSYTISNTGTASLTLGTVTFSNPNYTLTKPLGTSIESGGTAGFSIKYTPSTLGTSACTVTIPNNDLNENPYTFALTGVGVSSGGMNVVGNSDKLVKDYSENKVQNVAIYPNPASDVFNVATDNEDATIFIISLEGKLMKVIRTDSKVTAIDSRNWPTGVYIIQVQTANGNYTKKLIVSK